MSSAETAPRRNPTTVWLALLALTVAALGVRFLGLDFGLPHLKEKDAEIIIQTSHFRGKELKSMWMVADYGTYPTLIAHLTHLTLSKMEPPGEGASVEQHMLAAAEDHLDTRRTVAWLSALIVPAVWFLARRFVGSRWALLAAALMGASLLHLFFSQQARPHAPALVLFVLTMTTLLAMRRAPTLRAHLFVGLALSGLIAILHSGIAMFFPLAVASLMRKGRARGVRGLVDWRLIVPAALFIVAVAVFYWPMFDPALREINAGQFDGETTVTMPNHVIDFRRFNGSGLPVTLVSLRSYEPTLCVLTALAALVWIAARVRRWPRAGDYERTDVLVVLSFVVPYALAISLWEENYERFVLPLLPYMAIFVAWAGRAVFHRMGASPARFAAVVVAFLAPVLPAYSSARLAWIRSRPDTVEQAATWLEENVDPAASKIFIQPWWDLPLTRTHATLHHREGKARPFHNQSQWKTYQAREAVVAPPPPHWQIVTMVALTRFDNQTVEGLREYLDYYGPGYYVIDAKTRGHPWMKFMSEELGARGALMRRFSPDADVWTRNYPLLDQDGVEEDFPDLTPRVLQATGIGPVVEIYRVD